jgi:S1-C subfamily serine protease
VSIGHVAITAGTLGCLTSEGYILSNNHVLANSNNAQPGDHILQPGPHDGGTVESDLIATLHNFIPVEFGCPVLDKIVGGGNRVARLIGSRYRLKGINNAENLVDAALANPMSSDLVTPEILGIGEPVGTAEAELGMDVVKSGRTTEVTAGVVTQIGVTANVMYGNQMAIFVDQVMAGPMCAGGDSGSVVLDLDHRVVGLLFAGSEQTTLFNRIQNVTDLLGVTIP